MAKTFEELVAEARDRTEQLSIEDAKAEYDSGNATILDVREPDEREKQHIPGSKFIPRGLVEYLAAERLPQKDERILLHCASGGRSALTASTLREMGYTNVANIQGGINAWHERGYEIGIGL